MGEGGVRVSEAFATPIPLTLTLSREGRGKMSGNTPTFLFAMPFVLNRDQSNAIAGGIGNGSLLILETIPAIRLPFMILTAIFIRKEG
jgi:hypothetical protein